MFDIEAIREEFPITKQCFNVYDCKEPKKLIYFDHGASTHPPLRVINKYTDFLKHYYSNVHRGRHFLSMISTELFDKVYQTIFDYIHADKDDNAIILTSNTTTALDMASCFMKDFEGITLVSLMEHHSNDLPHRHRGKVMHYGLNKDGTINLEDLEGKLKKNKIKLVAVTGGSNVTGFLPDIHYIAKISHKYGAKILVDAAQLLAHHIIDVKPNPDESHIDFLAAAGHKAYAPFGSAFLFGPREILDRTEPYIPGGGTVLFVTEDDYVYATSPDRHQGGTPNIAGAIALAESINFLSEIGLENIREHEVELTKYAFEKFAGIPEMNILGDIPVDKRLGVIAFNINGLNNGLVSTILNHESAIATRNGRFCAHPYITFLLKLHNEEEIVRRLKAGEKLDIGGAVRASFGLYNTKDEIDTLADMLKKIAEKKWKASYDKFSPSESLESAILNSA